MPKIRIASDVKISDILNLKHELIFQVFETIFRSPPPPPLLVSQRQNMSKCYFAQIPYVEEITRGFHKNIYKQYVKFILRLILRLLWQFNFFSTFYVFTFLTIFSTKTFAHFWPLERQNNGSPPPLVVQRQNMSKCYFAQIPYWKKIQLQVAKIGVFSEKKCSANLLKLRS